MISFTWLGAKKSPAVQGSFSSVTIGFPRCKKFSESKIQSMGSTAVQAHRGSPDPTHGVRENTVAAFLRARDLGADGVELDVRMTVDGALAVHHNAEVDGVGAVCELAASELPDDVPLLPEVLEALEGLTVNVEIKNLPNEPGFDPAERVAREVAALINRVGRESDVVISSFWPGALEAVRDSSADLVTALFSHPGVGMAAPTSRSRRSRRRSAEGAPRCTPSSTWWTTPWSRRPTGPACRSPPGR